MSDLRKDPISGRWVIIATDRAKRPRDYSPPAAPPRTSSFCPFCQGNESHTPPEILAYRPPHTAPNLPGWRVRVVPNKFPALQVEGNLGKRGDG
ncbi:MAG: galactose-1-phosphate uridylyltransferase, partial [Planctomycetaceae bacterium]